MFKTKPMTIAGLTKKYEALRIATAVGIGLLLCFALILIVCPQDPWTPVFYMLVGPFNHYNRIAQVIEKMQPMLITGCSFMLMMSVGNFSLINTSCVSVAPCIICTPIILNEALFGRIPGEAGKIIWVTASCIGAALVGALVSLLPPIFKKFFSCDEIITSSLLNTVFSYLVEWYVKNILYDYESGIMASKPYPENVKLTRLVYGSRLTTMIIVGMAICIVTYFFLYYTRLGFAARMVGKSPSFARAAGIDVRGVFLLVSAIAGAIAGIAGTLNTLSYNQRFSGYSADISDGMFCGIFAKNNPLLLPIAALGLSYLRVTTETMANNTDVPSELLSVMTSFIIMMLAADQMYASIRDRKIKENFAKPQEEE